ncbi:helix-turn-helix domain-containing protein [Bacillus sp. N9]
MQKKPGSGIKINASYEDKLALLQLLNVNHNRFDPLSIETRRLSIFSKLLYSKQTTSLQKLSEEYMVSTTSIVNDLDKIEEWIRHYNIQLVRNREGTSISGNEENIRRAISGIVNDHLSIGAINERFILFLMEQDYSGNRTINPHFHLNYYCRGCFPAAIFGILIRASLLDIHRCRFTKSSQSFWRQAKHEANNREIYGNS